MILEVALPVGRPSELVVQEDQPLDVRKHGWVGMSASLGDAGSSHLEISIKDDNVDIRAFDVRDVQGSPLGLGPLEAVRHTRDTLAVYTAETERPRRANVRVRLQSSSHVRYASRGAAALTMSATAAIVLVEGGGPAFAEKLTLLSLPATIAAAIVLGRESTPLANRLVSRSRLVLAAALLLLWSAIVVRSAGSDILDWLVGLWPDWKEVIRWIREYRGVR